MTAFEVYARAGVIALGTLAVLHTIVWRVEGWRSSMFFAGAYTLGSIFYLFDAKLNPVDGHVVPVAQLLAMIMGVFMVCGMIEYVGIDNAIARRLRLTLVGISTVVVLAAFTWRLPLMVGIGVFGFTLLAQAFLAGWATWREPRRGHELVLGAMLLQPLVVVASAFGWIDKTTLHYAGIAPAAIAGATVLMSSLLQARQTAKDELLERRRAEEALRLVNAELDQRVASRTAELHDLVAGLETFNRNVSHDLRGPLGGISGLSQVAIDTLKNGDQATTVHLLELIKRQADTSAELLNALLTLAKSADAPISRQQVNLNALVRDAMDQLQLAQLDPRPLPIVVHAELPVVFADASLLRQVLVNLIGNALKFSAKAPAPRVEVGICLTNGNTTIYVRDNGIGFDSAKAQAVFEPFLRLHSHQFQGHGIGLSIVKRIVERHGGRIWVTSSPGEGATFFFTLDSTAAGKASQMHHSIAEEIA